MMLECPHFPPDGGAEGDRTPDLVIANDALSQLSYGPVQRMGGIYEPAARAVKRQLAAWRAKGLARHAGNG